MPEETKVRPLYADDMWRRANAALAHARRSEKGSMSVAYPARRSMPIRPATLRPQMLDADG